MDKQRTYFRYYFLFFLSLFFIHHNFYAQSITKTYNFPKFEILQFDDNNKQIKLLTFDGAITTAAFKDLPALWDKIEVNQLYTSYSYTLFNAKYEMLPAEQAALIPNECTFAEPAVHLKTATNESKYYAMLRILPVIKDGDGQYKRLVSCDIRFEGTDPIMITKTVKSTNSALKDGRWYKIAVNSSGLYKVTYEDLKKMGVPVSGLHSSNITLFGNGGGMIPNVNPVIQKDELLEVPIRMVNADNVFNENSYFIFYAQGPHLWTYNETTGIFTHNYNIYSDNAYYFINIDGIGEKKRIETKDFSNQTENGSVTSFTHYDFYEKDVMIFAESGRDWFDESFYVASTKSYTFQLPELNNTNARVKIRVATTSTTTSTMELTWGNNSRQFSLGSTYGEEYAKATTYEQNLPLTSGNLELKLKYSSAQSSAVAHLDYIEIQAQCKLSMMGDAMPFAITDNVGASNISLVQLENASAQTIIWDVTDHNAVYAVKGTLSGSRFSFKTPTDKPRCFIAFNGTPYNSVTPVGEIKNQNLHGFTNVDMVIVAHPDFLSEAERLTQFRRNKMKVEVVTPEQVYNEFSSGAQDPAAIRNFMRYLYDNNPKSIKYLLLFGSPSYDYRGRVEKTQLFVPNFQGNKWWNENVLRSCDDFFGVLGVGSGNLDSGDLMDVAVGRFPVSTLAQAKIAVDKTINASDRKRITLQNASQVSNFGDWRNVMAFVADDWDGVNHLNNAEVSTNEVAAKYPTFNLDKIYCDAYPSVSYAGGRRYPAVNNAINMRMSSGALTIAYFGHGGINGWSHERILEISNITNWKNKYNQPLMITLTCTFGWYDRPVPSPAELVFLNENGGASSLISTSRISYSNKEYGKQLFTEMGTKMNNRYKTIGEIQKLAKNNSGGLDSGVDMIYLIGDPAMTINIPNHNVTTEKILGEDSQKVDTIKALSKVTIKGRITKDDGETLSDFNGNIYPSIFDKSVKQKTLGQVPNSPITEFTIQKNIIFKGNATVTNGLFEFSFYVPKDINFEYGKGKISYYAASENDDAGDYYNNFIIGGMSDKPIADDKGPEIALFLNDEKFVPGGITNPDPVILVKLKDEYGINTTGNGIGHDLVAILDNNIEKQMVLNDYYLADQDSYNSGTVLYPLQKLAPGMHTLKVRAWDICNNPAEASIDFVVKTDDKLILDHVLNYPNPFTTKTSFFFEHNQPAETFDILIHIFTVSGKLVKTLQSTQKLEGNRSDPIEWDGRDEYGDKIGKGVYLYRLTVRNSQGKTAEKIEKIAIL
ncbi:MAG: type IX secretion system sortase PorU [Bacteroidetes bacterium]|nr:type IX secretion system sortase PorU [Bacteroidota bacterium]MCL1968722.1 type IX secretion system sortase PorU [Bacteroidota bacterium]